MTEANTSGQGSLLATAMADAIVRGAERAGIDSCVYLPDSVLTGTIRKFESSGKFLMLPCTREDEGIAAAVGLHLGGRNPICLMESSGLGYSPLILARALAQRTPVFIVASHGYGPGELFDYHCATFLVAEGVFRGLNIPYSIASNIESLDDLVERSVQTARGQLTCYGVIVPPYLARGR